MTNLFQRATQRFRYLGSAVLIALLGSTLVLTATPVASASLPTAVGIAATPDGRGYWAAYADGNVRAIGSAPNYGSVPVALAQPIVGIASTPGGGGYWLVGADGGIFSFGNAQFYGSTGAIRLNNPVVGIAATPTGRGYWTVASDGGVFSFGDAPFVGSTGNIRLNQAVVGIAGMPNGRGYWLAASDGGIFSFGDARFLGSTGNIRINQAVVGITATHSGNGYWLAAADGGIFSFGDAAFFGAAALGSPATAITNPGNLDGYWLVSRGGTVWGSPVTPPGVPVGPTGNVGSANPASLQQLNPPGGVLAIHDDVATLSNVLVHGGIDFYGRSLTLRNVYVEGGYGWWGFVTSQRADATIDIADSTISSRGGFLPDRNAGDGIFPLSGGRIVAQRILIQGTVDGMKMGSNSVLENSVIQNLSAFSDTHNDGIQVMGGSNLTIRNNRIATNLPGSFDPSHHNAALFFQPLGGGSISNVDIENNFLMGGGYTVRFEGNTTGVRAVNNVFGPGGWAPAVSQPSVRIDQWENNQRGDVNGVPNGQGVGRP